LMTLAYSIWDAKHAQYLADALESLYTITTEWPGVRY
jgi:hypothetical protein